MPGACVCLVTHSYLNCFSKWGIEDTRFHAFLVNAVVIQLDTSCNFVVKIIGPFVHGMEK